MPTSPSHSPTELRRSAPRTVLIVDDDPDILEVSALSLSRLGGFRVLVASTGEEGLAIAAREAPDLILLDLMMPGLDGHETLERLLGSEATAHIPVLLLTAMSALDRSCPAGAAGWVGKPFDPIALPETVRRLLEHR